MIPAAFDYHVPSTVGEATALLARLGEDAKVLSGGQSLIPLMKLRLASPCALRRDLVRRDRQHPRRKLHRLPAAHRGRDAEVGDGAHGPPLAPSPAWAPRASASRRRWAR